jgi:hypothetical protein
MEMMGRDWDKRMGGFKARKEAFDQAEARLKPIFAVHQLWTAFTILMALVIEWIYPTIRMGIVLAVVLMLIRWAGNMLITFKYVNPELKRIDEEFPAPEKRT